MIEKYLVYSWLLALSLCCAAATETLPGNKIKKCWKSSPPPFTVFPPASPLCALGTSWDHPKKHMESRGRLCWGCAHPTELLGQLVLQQLLSPLQWELCSPPALPLPSLLPLPCAVYKGTAKCWSLLDNQSYLMRSCVQEGVKCRWLEDPGEQQRASGDVPMSLLRPGWSTGRDCCTRGPGVPEPY